ncbi:MAG: chemotaxis protein CheW [Pirellulales bacterium]|nr:chemotaxis protein CheW [Pirellulales bacterium]
MSTTLEVKPKCSLEELQLVTFYVGDLLLGLDILQLQEIIRNFDVTPAPHAPDYVLGVINLRGDVVTVVDLRTVLGYPPAEVTRETRNLIVESQGEFIGLLVDRIADTVSITLDAIEPCPSNIDGVEGRFFRGVYTTETDIVVILDLEETLSNM